MACKHEDLQFDKGEFFIKCLSCPRAWQAVQSNLVVPDYTAMVSNLTPMDTRHSPYMIPKLVRKEEDND